MKLYLSSYRIPSPNELSRLVGKPLHSISVALIPNAKDYYSERARSFKVGDLVSDMEQLGLKVAIVDLRNYREAKALQQKLSNYDLVWAMGGNTYVLRYEMRRSGFDTIIQNLLAAGVVYGGDSAGALVAGLSIASVESADEPEFAEEVITDGIGLVPFVVLPHADNPEFANVMPVVRGLHRSKNDVIELTDAQAVIFDGGEHRIVEASNTPAP